MREDKDEGDTGRAAVGDGSTRQITASELRELARLHGLVLDDADARDLLPRYVEHQRWLETLRRTLGDGEEPAPGGRSPR